MSSMELMVGSRQVKVIVKSRRRGVAIGWCQAVDVSGHITENKDEEE